MTSPHKNLSNYLKLTSDSLISAHLLERKTQQEGLPILFKKGKGAWVWDEQKNVYLDFYLSGGSLILGHSDREITELLRKQTKKGISRGYPSRFETNLALEVLRYIPQADKIAFFASRNLALLAAINLAVSLTERQKILTFAGCRKIPLVFMSEELPLDDETLLEEYFSKNGEKTALVVVEALPSGMGLLPQKPKFFQTLRELTLKYGTLLLFDESATAFRGEAFCLSSSLYLEWDFLLLGESISYAFPFAALLGKKESFLNVLKKENGTDNIFSEGPTQISLLAAFYTLNRLVKDRENENLINLSAELEKRFQKVVAPLFKTSPIKLNLQVWPGLFCFRFEPNGEFEEVRSTKQIFSENNRWYSYLQRQLLKKGIYLPPNPNEPAFLSTSHQEKELDFFIKALQKVSLKIVEKIQKEKDKNLS